ncbi:hypothetical protein EJ04DRAFT_195236 [Polyplosphaeria fusca]|uniref:Uncharacterized protein n=1 Tax=Polyplosphaeria fusca TaxID=682080 RepID=A0A9P4QXH2_9PLEO|nr:hypothetical protein EJ04DRAFT_195236 [Polyplosphaeria fusca]
MHHPNALLRRDVDGAKRGISMALGAGRWAPGGLGLVIIFTSLCRANSVARARAHVVEMRIGFEGRLRSRGRAITLRCLMGERCVFLRHSRNAEEFPHGEGGRYAFAFWLKKRFCYRLAADRSDLRNLGWCVCLILLCIGNAKSGVCGIGSGNADLVVW